MRGFFAPLRMTSVFVDANDKGFCACKRNAQKLERGLGTCLHPTYRKRRDRWGTRSVVLGY